MNVVKAGEGPPVLCCVALLKKGLEVLLPGSCTLQSLRMEARHISFPSVPFPPLIILSQATHPMTGSDRIIGEEEA